METQTLYAVKKLNALIKKDELTPMIFKDICRILGESLESGVMLFESTGDVKAVFINDDQLGYNIKYLKDLEDEKASNENWAILNDIKEPIVNCGVNSIYIPNLPEDVVESLVMTFLPIYSSGEKVGLLSVYRLDEKFTAEEVFLCEGFVTTISPIMVHIDNKIKTDKVRKLEIVKSAVATLSYSEYEAIVSVMKEFVGNEGILVASKVAEKTGITRSVIVNAIRKFESANVLESRSLGMKGTYIKVLNEHLRNELKVEEYDG